MLSVKPKRKLRVLAASIGLAICFSPIAHSTGIPNFDAGNNAENLLQITRLFERYRDILGDYTDKLNLDKYLHNIKMEMESNLTAYSNQETLKHEENLHNAEIAEMSQPVEEICEIIASKPDQSVTNERIIAVAKMQDAHQAMSVGGHTHDKTNVGITSENGKLTEVSGAVARKTFVQKKFEMDKAIVENLKDQKSCLLESFSSKDAWIQACEGQADNPTSIQGEYIMSSNAYFSHDSETSEAMRDLVKLVAPPYMTDSAGENSVSNKDVVEDIRNQTMSALASSMLHDVVARRTPGEETESEMALMDALDGFYYGNINTPYEETLAAKFSNSVLSTPTLLMREMAEMQAMNIHLSLMEYKLSLNKEVALSNRLINKYKKG